MRAADGDGTSRRPRVCVAVPVYNGERYLAHTLEALLAQTFGDLEVVVADNASTDRTGSIAASYQRRDPRVRYVRYDEHVGVAESYTRAFHLSSSGYFMWAASDDVVGATFVERAVQELDHDPSAIGCYARTAVIDSRGEVVRTDDYVLDLADPHPGRRFGRLVLAAPKRHGAYEQYGVFRAAALRQTCLMSGHAYGDRVLLAQLCLTGRLVMLPEVLFHSRDHEGRSQRSGRRSRPGTLLTRPLGPGPWPPAEFWDHAMAGRITFPEWHLLARYARSVRRAALPAPERLRCWAALGVLVARSLPKLGRDLAVGLEQAGWLAARRRRPWRGGLPRAAA